MSLSTIYSKTGKGAQVLTGKNKALPADSMRVLSLINGESNAYTIHAQLGQLTEDELLQILARLLEGGHIRVVANENMQDFFSGSGSASTIDVMEISAEEFLKTEASAHDLNSETKIRQQKEAVARAKAHAEEQLTLEAQAQAQQENERNMLELTDILVNSVPTEDASSVTEQDDQKEAISRAHSEEEVGAKEVSRLAGQEEEARARLEAETRARLENEKARVAAEREATEKARQEAVAIARRKAEEAARIAAELNAQEETKRLARIQAEAEAKARREQEEARIAAEREEAERARQEAMAIARREAKEKARIAADLKARQATEGLARKQAEAEAKILAKEKSKHEAEAKALLKADEKARKRSERDPVDAGKWIRSIIGLCRKLLITASATTLVLLLVLQLVNLGMLVSPLAGPVERLLSDNINEPVTIRKVYASLWPKPHLVLDDIAIGESNINIETIRVLPALSTLFDESITLQYIKVSGLTIDKNDIHRPLQWMAASTKRGRLKFDQILLEKTSFIFPQVELPPLDGELNFIANGEFGNAVISSPNQSAVIRITPLNGSLAIDLAAKDWQLPLGTPVVFDELNASGIIENSGLNFSQIKGRLYGGNIKAVISIDWATGWAAKGNFKLSEVELEELMPKFSTGIALEGPVTSNATFSLQSNELADLFSKPEINANFNIDGGSINGIDLGRAMKAGDKNDIAGSTRFNALSGSLWLLNGNYKYRQLALKAGQLRAAGEIDVLANQDIAGTVNISLDTKSRQMQSHLSLSGKIGDPALR
jgi:hypothetical protein